VKHIALILPDRRDRSARSGRRETASALPEQRRNIHNIDRSEADIANPAENATRGELAFCRQIASRSARITNNT
jgi:hypothetical protein